MEDKYMLIECFLNDEHYEYVCDNNEFMTYRVKNIVDVDVFVFYHCNSEIKQDKLDNGIRYDVESQKDFVKVSYNFDLDYETKGEIAKVIRESLVYVDYPFVENEDGDMVKDYDVESPCYLSVKYVQFNKCNDDCFVFDASQEVVVQSMEDWEE